MQIVECVPNISEGRDVAVIEAILNAVTGVDGAYLLHKDIGMGANRTVITFAGGPEAVLQAAFNVIEQTSQLIDMRNHKGSHPRIGATDVCPLIPISNITMAECVELSKRLASRVGNELGIPTYLYGESAQSPERRLLSYIRGGEYENLFLRIDELVFKPDFGPVVCNWKSGATAIGARKMLIAYNIDLDTKDLKIAKTIAQSIREQRQLHEQKTDQAQQLTWKESQAIAWYIDEYRNCQISLNLLDYKQTSLHQAFLGVKNLASLHGVKVISSEIIGLVPLQALLDTGRFIVSQGNNQKMTFSDDRLISEAITFLNLSKHFLFKASEKVLEYKLNQFGLLVSPSAI